MAVNALRRSVQVTAALLLAAAPVLADGGAAHRAVQPPPVKMGTSGGSVADASRSFCCSGTLGALVNYNGALHILSNNHVLGRSGSAVAGEDTLQPGLIDTGCRSTGSNIVADYAGDVTPLGSANIDAAVSRVRAGMVDTTGAILDIGVPCSTTQVATPGLPVMKSGRTTGFTTGSVQAVNVNVSIQYQRGCASGKKFTVSFTNQVSITPGTFSAGGDSGSLILSNDGTPHPVALLYAGSSAVTIGNPIQNVVAAYGPSFSFVGSSCGGAATAEKAMLAGPSEFEIDFAKGVQERVQAELFELPGVLGVGIGVSDVDSDEAALVLYVETRPGSKARNFPREIDGLKVKVVETDPIVARVACASAE